MESVVDMPVIVAAVRCVKGRPSARVPNGTKARIPARNAARRKLTGNAYSSFL